MLVLYPLFAMANLLIDKRRLMALKARANGRRLRCLIIVYDCTRECKTSSCAYTQRASFQTSNLSCSGGNASVCRLQ